MNERSCQIDGGVRTDGRGRLPGNAGRFAGHGDGDIAEEALVEDSVIHTADREADVNVICHGDVSGTQRRPCLSIRRLEGIDR